MTNKLLVGGAASSVIIDVSSGATPPKVSSASLPVGPSTADGIDPPRRGSGPSLGSRDFAMVARELGISDAQLRWALLELGAVVKRSVDEQTTIDAALADAVLRNDTQDIQKYLARGGDPNQKIEIPKALRNKYVTEWAPAPLASIAAALGHAEALALLAPHIDLDLSFDCLGLAGISVGDTKAVLREPILNANPLVVAAYYNRADCIEALAKHSVRLDRSMSFGEAKDSLALVSRAADRAPWDAFFKHPDAAKSLASRSQEGRTDVALHAVYFLDDAACAEHKLFDGLKLSNEQTLDFLERFWRLTSRRDLPLVDRILAAGNLTPGDLGRESEYKARCFGDDLLKHPELRARWLSHSPIEENRPGFAKLTLDALFFAVRGGSSTGDRFAEIRELAERIVEFDPSLGPQLGNTAALAAIHGDEAIVQAIEEIAKKRGFDLEFWKAPELFHLVKWDKPKSVQVFLEFYARHEALEPDMPALRAELAKHPDIAALDWCKALVPPVAKKMFWQ